MRYVPRGVCSREMNVELEGRRIKKISVIGGCSGNMQGVVSLLIGMDVDEAIEKIRGIKCGDKQTSCPDQLSIALVKAKKL